ncbi:MAG: UDP-3-O-(3-hydroxymyristoyl)glucosamine N-acyltransferase [Phycisphaerales bacterium]|nr:UDP-3-O-(3-hydroxymyristoyl)glucosamine N-acyltransferase [Phycisphaerales bacterium]
MQDTPTRSLTTSEIARLVGGTLHGRDDITITGIQSVADASATDVTLITSRRYVEQWSHCAAAAALVHTAIELEDVRIDGRPIIHVADAEIASIALLELFAVPESVPDAGVHETAIIGTGVTLGAGVRIGPHVTVGDGTTLGDGVILHPGVQIASRCRLGDRTVVYGNVVIFDNTDIGSEVVIHPNVSIGAAGFGYRPAPDGSGLMRMPHNGTVQIENRVEIGPNTIVARGKFGPTRIGEGTKIDGHVSVAHNVRIGRHCIIAGQSGLGGSVHIGDGVVIGGRSCVRDHITMGDGSRLAGGSILMDDLGPGQDAAGCPALTGTDGLRQWMALRRLPRLIRSLSRQE